MDEILFLRQSIRSDYCAVYATAMALTVVGCTTDKKTAMAIFKAKPGCWYGANHADISNAIRVRVNCFKGKWRHIKKKSAADVLNSLRRSVSTTGAVVATAYCCHRKLNLLCGHAFVLTGFDEEGIYVLDPLGQMPEPGLKYNAKITFIQNSGANLLRVSGAVWDISLNQGVSLLKVPSIY